MWCRSGSCANVSKPITLNQFRILFSWLSTDAGIDEKGVGVMCLQLEETILYQFGALGRLDSEASSSGVT